MRTNRLFKLLIVLALLILTLVTIKRFYNPLNYNSVIKEADYFGFQKGYVYKSRDTVFISRFSDKISTMEIRNLNTGEVHELTWQGDEVVDFSDTKYHELNPKGFTDYFIVNAPGMYLALLKDGQENYSFGDVFFVNDGGQPNNAKIKVILSDYNWVAYNEFGGRSNYRDYITPAALKFFQSFQETRRKHYALNIYKPNSANSNEIRAWIEDDYKFKEGRNYHCIVSEIPLIKFLYSNYSPDNIEILDCNSFENYQGERNTNLFIFNGHSEYWTEEIMAQLNNLKMTNNILFFSGNNMYRKVVRSDNSLYVTENVIDQKTTSELTGLYYTPTGYMQNSSFRIVNRNHFLFRGINVESFGGEWVVSHETDKLTVHTPLNVEVLARGSSVPCDLILMTNNKNYLLNTGSLGSYNGLEDHDFQKFIKNYVELTVKESLN